MRLRITLPIIASLFTAGLLVASVPADAAQKSRHPAKHAVHLQQKAGAAKSKLGHKSVKHAAKKVKKPTAPAA